MNRIELQGLALRRLDAARCLLANRHFDSAYYLAGYAVECGLKAGIARQFREHDFPDKKIVNDSYTHDLEKLVRVAKLEGALNASQAQSSEFEENWEIVKAWSEESRYEHCSEDDAKEFLFAIDDVKSGVFAWLQHYW
jgi:HEPN domain-containing protein